MGRNNRPLDGDLTPEEKHALFARVGYDMFNGVRREVRFVDETEVAIEHGLGFKPNDADLTVRVHLRFDPVGEVVYKRSDDTHVYVAATGRGRAIIEVSHPPAPTTV